jgi:3-hydroxyisobutyrate dehydrogenase-like beta-hydroxyacid dehydrogenase
MEVGIVGLGRMGSAIARRLIEAGHQVKVHNRTPSRAETLKIAGAVIADSPADASSGDVVITILADDPAVEAAVFGPHGVFQGLGKNQVHISMSTITVALSERLAATHLAAGQGYLAAPVFGRPDAGAWFKGGLHAEAG